MHLSDRSAGRGWGGGLGVPCAWRAGAARGGCVGVPADSGVLHRQRGVHGGGEGGRGDPWRIDPFTRGCPERLSATPGQFRGTPCPVTAEALVGIRGDGAHHTTRAATRAPRRALPRR